MEDLYMALRRTLYLQFNEVWPLATSKGENLLNIPWPEWDILNKIDEDEANEGFAQMSHIVENPAWKDFDRFRQTNAEFSIFDYTFKDFFPPMKTGQDTNFSESITLEAEDAADMKLSTTSLIGRRLATTENGFIGLVPEQVLVGDFIAVLYGCGFPVALRQVGECYQYIGECYIDGIMDGELIEAKQRGEFQEIEIILC
jgi:hypothetical protein